MELKGISSLGLIMLQTTVTSFYPTTLNGSKSNANLQRQTHSDTSVKFLGGTRVALGMPNTPSTVLPITQRRLTEIIPFTPGLMDGDSELLRLSPLPRLLSLFISTMLAIPQWGCSGMWTAISLTRSHPSPGK